MPERLSAEEVAILIRARQIQKAKGLAKDADVRRICEAAGVSRKTGYRWASNLMGHSDEQERNYARQLAQLKAEHEHLKERYRRVDIENEGRKLAWEIHGVDELLAAKKNATHKNRSKRP